ncbi:MAG TPA: GDP-mannose 4,6-dehydratase [Terriglobia bacterium]|nr:GDP-mannose 4,6-dehydratase [Terriglobia bacterium]
MSKILLTGGAGFIGSHLGEHLVRDAHRLLILDDLNDFYSPAIKRRNLEEVRRVGPIEFVEADVCDQERLESIFAVFNPEVVVHLAARAGVRPSLEQPLLYERVNVFGTALLLELSKKHKVGKFVFASSSSVYGTTSKVPFSEEEANPYPISPYGVTKLAGEKLCYCYANLYGIPVVCLRFFTVYGPRQRPDLAIYKFASLIEQGLEVPLFGDGSSLRDYTYIDDIVEGILAAVELESSFEIFNLGNSNPISLLEMVRLLEAKLGKQAKARFQNSQPGDMPFTHADLNKARRLLNFVPKVPFETGVDRFVEWFRKTRIKK